MSTIVQNDEMHQLWPQLPAELRNHVYSYLGDSSATATPLLHKSHQCAHTSTTIIPTHNGNTSLLELARDNVLEGKEYESYLLPHGVQVRIAIHFTGHIHTFIHQHWADKITRHWNKLLKSHAWLAKAKHFDIRVLWDPKSTSGQRVKNCRAGEIVSGLTSTILGFQDRSVAVKGGDAKVRLHIPFVVANQLMQAGTVFGLDKFLHSNGDDVRRVCKEVVLGKVLQKSSVVRVAPGLVARKHVEKSELEMLEVKNGSAEWSHVLGGIVLAKMVVEDRTERRHLWPELGTATEDAEMRWSEKAVGAQLLREVAR